MSRHLLLRIHDSSMCLQRGCHLSCAWTSRTDCQCRHPPDLLLRRQGRGHVGGVRPCLSLDLELLLHSAIRGRDRGLRDEHLFAPQFCPQPIMWSVNHCFYDNIRRTLVICPRLDPEVLLVLPLADILTNVPCHVKCFPSYCVRGLVA